MSDWKADILKVWEKKQSGNKFVVPDSLKDRLIKEVRGEVLYREPMSRHTSVRVGGPADVFIKPLDIDDLKRVYVICAEEDVPLTLMGAGSNTLVKDGGVRGFVVVPPENLKNIQILEVDEQTGDLICESGVKITRAVMAAKEASLSGLETFVGIPGSIGGAVMMNAGAHKVEMKEIIREITVLTREGEIVTIPREKLDFEYRKLKLPKTHFVLSVKFRLEKKGADIIAAKIEECQKWRVEKQPLQYPNSGSVFKNPEAPKSKLTVVTPSAGQLIEEAGLKNVRVGGARISEKHANFIINENQATAKDILVLINLAREKVKEMTGTVLETEVKIIGED